VSLQASPHPQRRGQSGAQGNSIKIAVYRMGRRLSLGLTAPELEIGSEFAHTQRPPKPSSACP
jgi:hypothetical protein